MGPVSSDDWAVFLCSHKVSRLAEDHGCTAELMKPALLNSEETNVNYRAYGPSQQSLESPCETGRYGQDSMQISFKNQ